MDRFQRPTDDERAQRLEDAATAIENDLANLRRIKLAYKEKIATIIDEYFKEIDPKGETFDEATVADLVESIHELLAEPYYTLRNDLEKKFEEDTA